MGDEVEQFNKWHDLKIQIHFQKERPYFKEREIWWASIGQNIGDEIYGKSSTFERPVLIINRFYNNLALIIPISSKVKCGNYYIKLPTGKISGVLVIPQIRVIDSKRLLRKVEILDENTYIIIINKIKALL